MAPNRVLANPTSTWETAEVHRRLRVRVNVSLRLQVNSRAGYLQSTASTAKHSGICFYPVWRGAGSQSCSFSRQKWRDSVEQAAKRGPQPGGTDDIPKQFVSLSNNERLLGRLLWGYPHDMKRQHASLCLQSEGLFRRLLVTKDGHHSQQNYPTLSHVCPNRMFHHYAWLWEEGLNREHETVKTFNRL